MSLKKQFSLAVLCMGLMGTVQAADQVHDLDFKAAVDRAVADGTLDGSVKFYLSGTKSGGKVYNRELLPIKKPMALPSLLKALVIEYYVQL